MPQFHMAATTIRAITDIVSLSVEAEDLTEAMTKAELVLDNFPNPHTVEGVSYVYVDHRDYGDVAIMDLKEIEQEEDDDIGVT